MQQKKESQIVTDPQTTEQPEKTAVPKKVVEFDDNDVVTVIWKNWGMSGMPRNKVTYLGRHQFIGGVGRRIPYKEAKLLKQLGNGIILLPMDAEDADFIKATGHAPMSDETLETMLRATPLDKIAAMLSQEQLDKITSMHKKESSFS